MSKSTGEMRRSLTLTGVTVNAMALIAPGAFLWTTFETQAALSCHGASTADGMWAGLFLSLVLALLTAYSYASWPGSTLMPAPARATTSPRPRSWTRNVRNIDGTPVSPSSAWGGSAISTTGSIPA